MLRLWVMIIVYVVLGGAISSFLVFSYLQHKKAPDDPEKGLFVKTIIEASKIHENLESAGVFIEKVIPEIMTKWDGDVYLSYAKPSPLPNRAMAVKFQLSDIANRYGPLTKYIGGSGNVQIFDDGEGRSLIATFMVKAVFEKKGEVEFKVVVLKKFGANEWLLEGFYGF
ncbi:hypothetical protein AB834_00895 [PVC group bacterium (ex Bugula neritina AB1)]|nr:hypothetical protein AB834_00895 [PVC group bacterium (ex Bugula neritina AB1)]